jgi:enoyl-CoA hydratase/carnithine racemase
MNEIVTERSGSVLRVQLNRPAKRNAMTSSMYVTLADIFNGAAKDEQTRVVLWHGAGDSFCAGNDVEDFLKNLPGPGESPQARLMNALLDFDKPLIAAVHGAAIGGGTTMLTHCVVSDQTLLATATETARKLAAKPTGALQASKRLMKRSFREQIKAAMKAENEEFSAQVRSEDAKEALTAFLEKRAPDFTKTLKSATAA